MLPDGSQPTELAQRPSGGSVENSAHVTPLVSAPQQSASRVQTSPRSRQPAAGAHTVAPLPGSTQSREQQVVPPAHGCPSDSQPVLPAPDTAVQVPAPPSVWLQTPEQQSVPLTQMSPAALQTYARTQRPPWQLVEQQSDAWPQTWPSVPQVAPATAAQAPPVQVPLQQSPAAPQAWPLGAQSAAWQAPPAHDSEQQSAWRAQAWPAVAQKVGVVHASAPPSPTGPQTPEQHGEPALQLAPGERHPGPPSRARPPSLPGPPSAAGPASPGPASGAWQVPWPHSCELQSAFVVQAPPAFTPLLQLQALKQSVSANHMES
jgi:hypothetical protein